MSLDSLHILSLSNLSLVLLSLLTALYRCPRDTLKVNKMVHRHSAHKDSNHDAIQCLSAVGAVDARGAAAGRVCQNHGAAWERP